MAIDKTNLKKHIGFIESTGSKIYLAFRKLPTDADHCLVIYPESLPDNYVPTLNDIINSKEAKDTNDLYEVLHRNVFPDGSNVLASLHRRQLLHKVPVSSVMLTPLSGTKVELGIINATIDKQVDEYMRKANDLSKQFADTEEAAKVLGKELTPTEKAADLIVQAMALEESAKEKREAAYLLDPTLVPKAGRPTKSEKELQETLDKQKTERREKDRARYAEMKKEIKSEELHERVMERVNGSKTQPAKIEMIDPDDEPLI